MIDSDWLEVMFHLEMLKWRRPQFVSSQCYVVQAKLDLSLKQKHAVLH